MMIFARHGLTVANTKGRIMGRSDSPLTREGMATIVELSLVLNHQPIDRIVASPLPRALKTAHFYGSALRARVRKDDRLAELSCGAWEGEGRASILGGDKPLRDSWSVRPPGGESYEDGENRLKTLVDELPAMQGDSVPLIVSHASIGRVFLKLALGLDQREAISLVLPHNTLFIIQENRLQKTMDNMGNMGDSLIFQS